MPISKTAQASVQAGLGMAQTRVPSFWVFTTRTGTGKAKYPVRGYADENLAQQHAKEIDGYVVNMSIKVR